MMPAACRSARAIRWIAGCCRGPQGGAAGYQDWKPAMWVLPSLRLSSSWRQVPFRALRVFHAWVQVLVSYCRPLPPAVPAEVAVLIGTAG